MLCDWKVLSKSGTLNLTSKPKTNHSAPGVSVSTAADSVPSASWKQSWKRIMKRILESNARERTQVSVFTPRVTSGMFLRL